MWPCSADWQPGAVLMELRGYSKHGGQTAGKHAQACEVPREPQPSGQADRGCMAWPISRQASKRLAGEQVVPSPLVA